MEKGVLRRIKNSSISNPAIQSILFSFADDTQSMMRYFDFTPTVLEMGDNVSDTGKKMNPFNMQRIGFVPSPVIQCKAVSVILKP